MSDGPLDDIAAKPLADRELLAAALPAPSLFEQLAAPFIADSEKGRKFGIDVKMLGSFLGYSGPATKEQLAGVTQELALRILRQRIWEPMGMGAMPEEVASALFGQLYAKGNDEGGRLLQRGIRSTVNTALKIDGRLATETTTALAHLVKEGKALALAENIIAHTHMSPLRFGTGKPPRRLQRIARAAVFVGKAAIFAKTGVKLP